MSALAEAAVVLAKRSVHLPREGMRDLLAQPAGRTDLSPNERRLARGVDAALRRLGVRCLRRSVVVTEMLRRRGIAARIRLLVAESDPRHAHADVEVGEDRLGPHLPGMVPLR